MATDKVVVITGGAQGIGAALCRHFTDHNARVVVADFNALAASELAAELVASGKTAISVEMDVTSEASVDAGMAAVVEKFGQIDVLVSNAGIQHISSLVDLTFADWKRTLAVHLDGGFLTARAAMRAMIEVGNGGSIVFIGSTHSKVASVLKAPYVTAKHGLLGLCRVIAKEGAEHGIRANVVCPGFVDTPLVRDQIPRQAAALGISEEEVVSKIMLKDTVDGEFTTISDVCAVVEFLALFPTATLTGQSLIVSHGWVME